MTDPRQGPDPSERQGVPLTIQRGAKEPEARVFQAVDSVAAPGRPGTSGSVGAIRRPEQGNEALSAKNRQIKGAFSCPLLHVAIATPCGLHNCRYHVDYHWSGNCLLIYSQQQGVDKLTVDEISYLYRRPVDEVKKLLDDGIAKLRGTAIDSASITQESLARRFNYLLTSRICCVCESTLEDEPSRGLRIEAIGAAYCSKDCRDAKPPRLVELEVEKGLPIERILEWTFRRYQTLSLAEQALSLPRWLVYEASRRFLGHTVDHYFPALRQQQNRRAELIRRTWHEPAWVDALVLRARETSRLVRARFGPVTVKTERFRQRLADVIANL